MQLRQGIPINQSPPSVYRANRRPLYIAIGTAGVVSILLVWAWVVRSNMRVIAQAKPTSSVAAPATSAMKTLDKQWSEKLPKAPETLAPLVSCRSSSRPDRPGFRGAQHADLRYPCHVATSAVPPLPQIPVQQQLQPPDEERAAWDSPMVPNRQALPHQEAQGASQTPVVPPPPPPPLPIRTQPAASAAPETNT